MLRKLEETFADVANIVLPIVAWNHKYLVGLFAKAFPRDDIWFCLPIFRFPSPSDSYDCGDGEKGLIDEWLRVAKQKAQAARRLLETSKGHRQYWFPAATSPGGAASSATMTAEMPADVIFA